MKKLKFMLAAATAIGLASALHADPPQYAGSTDFEDYEIGAVTSATDSAFFHLPATAEEGDYQIVSGTPDIDRPSNLPSWFTRGRNQVLQLEGGTDPLERYALRNATPVDLSANDVYVTATSGDKLMIYLQQVTNALGEVSTNLVAKAGYLTGGEPAAGGRDYKLKVYDGTEDGKQINAGAWYRLTVKAIKDVSGGDGVMGFRVYIDGHECGADAAPYEAGDQYSDDVFQDNTYYEDIVDRKRILISLLGPMALDSPNLKLTSVGFAGSGYVDDLVFTTLDPAVTYLSFTLAFDNSTGAFDAGVNYTLNGQGTPAPVTGQEIYCGIGTNVVVTYATSSAYTYSWSGVELIGTGNDTFTPADGATYTLSASATSVDYTFAFTGEHVNGVIYTVGEGMVVVTNKGETVPANSTLTVMGFVLDPWYVIASDSAVTNGSEFVISADNMSFAVTAVNTETGTVPAGTTLADVGIDGDATGLTDADLNDVAKWAYACVGTDAASIATVNEMRFSTAGEPTNLTAEAYLLNTNVNAEAVAQAKAEFAFTSFDPANPPEASDFDAKGYNGTVTIQGRESLSTGNWIDLPIVGIYPKFYRAILTKPVPTP